MFLITSFSGYDVCWNLSVTHSFLWSGCFLSLLFYLLLIQSSTVYFVSFISDSQTVSISRYQRVTAYLDGYLVSKFITFLPGLFFIVLWTWSGPCVDSGFGHLVFTSFERKMSLLAISLFLIYLRVLLPSFFFSSTKSYDLLITFYQITTWLTVLFYVSNILSLSFVIEILTGLVTLLIVTSQAHSSYSLPSAVGRETSQLTPFTTFLSNSYLLSLLIFFWTSLVTTLVLFLFLIFMYSKFLVIDWALVDLVMSYFTTVSTTFDLSAILFSSLLAILCILLKCAITPFFFWKPTFFKGFSFSSLFYYIFIFYFIIFLYFINFLMGQFSQVILFNTALLVIVILGSILILPGILYETINVKAFFAMSSIMNSVIILFTLLNSNFLSVHFFF